MNKVVLSFAAFAGTLLSASPAFASDGGSKMLPALDIALFPGVLFWMTVSFLALYIVMQFVGVPGIQKTIDGRQEMLDRDLESARKMSERAQAVVQSYEDDLHNARMQAHKSVSDIVAAAEAESSSMLEKQSTEIKHRMIVAQDKITAAKEQAIKDAEPHVKSLSDEVYGKVLQSGLSA